VNGSETLVAETAPAIAPTRSRGALAVLAVSAGLGVANLYYAQPLAAMMASSLRVSAAEIGLSLICVATAASALFVAFSPSYPAWSAGRRAAPRSAR
jgi:hypothetical protein